MGGWGLTNPSFSRIFGIFFKLDKTPEIDSTQQTQDIESKLL